MSQIISHVLEVGEIKIKMPPDLVPDENSPAHLQMTFLSLHMVEKERKRSPFYFYKATNTTGFGPCPYNLI